MIVPSWSRIVYDQAIRSVGARMVEVTTLDDLERAFGHRTAMATGLIHLGETGNPFSLEQYVEACHRRGIPVLIDAADGPRPAPEPPAVDVNGHWDVEIEYVVGKARHQFFLAMDGARVRGVHQGRIVEGRLRGTVAGDRVDLRSSARFEGTSLGFGFTGRVDGDAISGEGDLGEYGVGRWRARRSG